MTPLNEEDISFFGEVEGVLRQKRDPIRIRKTASKLKDPVTGVVKASAPRTKKPKSVADLSLEAIGNPCDGCVWESKPKKIAGTGDLATAKVLVIYDRPSFTELSKGLATDAGFAPIKAALQAAGFQPSEAYFASVSRCYHDIPGKNSPKGYAETVDQAINHCVSYLRKEILAPGIKAILLLGLGPFRSLVDKDKASIFHARGKIFDILGKPALVTFDTDQVKRRPDTGPLMIEACGRLFRLANGLFGKDYKPEYEKPRTAEDVIAALERYLGELNADQALGKRNVSAVDIESMYTREYGEKALDPWHEEFAVWSIGFSRADYKALAIPFDPHPRLIERFGLASIRTSPRIKELVQAILEHPCASHTQIDPRGLGAKYDIIFKDLEDSCLIVYASDDTAGQLSVDDLSHIHTEEGGYKDSYIVPQTMEDLDWDKFMDYNCHDADIERRIYYTAKQEAEARDVWAPQMPSRSGHLVAGGYWNVMRPANATCDEMTRNGVCVDREHLNKLITIERGKEAPLLARYFSSEEVEQLLAFLKSKSDGTKKTQKYAEIQTTADCDLGKTWVLEHLLYDVCKFRSDAKTEGGSRSTEADELEKFQKTGKHKQLLEDILEIKKIRKKLSTYLTPYVEPKVTSTGKIERFPYIKMDGLVHPYFNQHKVRTGRLSSENPNFQNIINDLDIKRMFIARNWAVIRAEIEELLQGFLIAGDYAQHEIRMAAWLTGDEMMIKALQFDFHTINLAVQQKLIQPNAIGLMTKPWLKELKEQLYKKFLRELAPELDSGIFDHPVGDIMECFDQDPAYKELLSKWKNLFKKRRTVAKESTFGPLYGMQPPTFAAINEISLREAEEVFELDRKTYPQKHAYFAEIKARAKKDGFVQSIFGKKRRLDYSMAFSEYQQAELDRQAGNTIVQGPSSDIGILAAGKIMEINKIQGIWSLVIGTIHDSIMQDSHPDCLEEALTIQATVME